ncbi:7-cyano-7-deazaguanine synthase [Candidatus Pacearchaeota archaeon]|nr:7-cyano-7-deazaguanine synthase [Candidatus Pacearchaeota archaeon]
MKKEIIVLCSGGIDSVTAAHMIKRRNSGSKMTIIFFNYGQNQLNIERKCARKCARDLSAEWIEFSIPRLKNMCMKRISTKYSGLKNTEKESKNWYIPFRNTLFISQALSFAESISMRNKLKKINIVTGFKCEGKEPYPDTTKEYLKVINLLARTAAPNHKIKVVAPLIEYDKEDIIKLGNRMGLNYRDTYSCYIGRKNHCGRCLACRLRKAGFYWAGLEDPTRYKI